MDSTNDPIVGRLDEDQCWNLLSRQEAGRLAVTIDGKPDIFPVNHVASITGRRFERGPEPARYAASRADAPS